MTIFKKIIKSRWQILIFQSIFLFDSFNFIMSRKDHRCFPWVIDLFYSIETELPNTDIWATIIVLLVWLKYKEKDQSDSWLKCLQSAFLSQASPFSVHQTCFLYISCFNTQPLRKTRSQGSRLNEINYFNCLKKDILKWDWLLPVSTMSSTPQAND